MNPQEFKTVGGTRTISVDVRIIAATHKDLDAFGRYPWPGKVRELENGIERIMELPFKL